MFDGFHFSCALNVSRGFFLEPVKRSRVCCLLRAPPARNSYVFLSGASDRHAYIEERAQARASTRKKQIARRAGARPVRRAEVAVGVGRSRPRARAARARSAARERAPGARGGCAGGRARGGGRSTQRGRLFTRCNLLHQVCRVTRVCAEAHATSHLRELCGSLSAPCSVV